MDYRKIIRIFQKLWKTDSLVVSFDGACYMKPDIKDNKKIEVIFKSFVHDISQVLCSSDLVISRAGAGSIAELKACNIPSILFPYFYFLLQGCK